MSTYDFIIVGSGPSGCAVASRLARSAKRPSVLLIEAGGKNEDKFRVDSERWSTFLNSDLNWGYKTLPQKNANGRIIDYSRGKGLGGSSCINFGIYNIGPSDDHDEIARLTGDETWSWNNSLQRYKNLETFHAELPSHLKKYVNPKPENHGTTGPLAIGFPLAWERDVSMNVDAFLDYGLPFCEDQNSGNPIGMAVAANSAYAGHRTTAADLLVNPPSNLTILTHTAVEKVLVDDKSKTVIGVEAAGSQYHASKEVILSAGSLDTPKILMLSGIGPTEELQKHKIPVVLEAPRVGKGLKDHYGLNPQYVAKEEINDRAEFYGNAEKMKAAREQWIKDGSGDLAKFACVCGVGFFKSDAIYASEEFKSLPTETQQFLQKSTVPCFELLTNAPNAVDFQPRPGFTGLNFWILSQNQQGRGEVTLQSSNPADSLLVDPHILEHPYDRRVIIEAVRLLLDVIKKSHFNDAIVEPISAPKSASEEDIWSWIQDSVCSVWHMTGTVKMGPASDAEAVVDTSFRLNGLKNLRVVDMSVVPLLPNNHPQTTAYLVGVVGSDKLIEEYGLE